MECRVPSAGCRAETGEATRGTRSTRVKVRRGGTNCRGRVRCRNPKCPDGSVMLREKHRGRIRLRSANCPSERLAPLGAARAVRSSGGLDLAHKGKLVWVLEGLNAQINVEVRPMEVIWACQCHVKDRSNSGVFEPRELLKRQEQLPIMDQDPKSMLRDVCNLNRRSAPAKPCGFHSHGPRSTVEPRPPGEPSGHDSGTLRFLDRAKTSASPRGAATCTCGRTSSRKKK